MAERDASRYVLLDEMHGDDEYDNDDRLLDRTRPDWDELLDTRRKTSNSPSTPICEYDDTPSPRRSLSAESRAPQTSNNCPSPFGEYDDAPGRWSLSTQSRAQRTPNNSPSPFSEYDDAPSPGRRSSSKKSRYQRTTRALRMPDRYAGKTSWIDYDAHFQAIKEINNWDNEEAARILASCLQGPACRVLYPTPVGRHLSLHELMSRLNRKYGSLNYTGENL